MKKLTKHASKRKWILGGVLAFAGVALLTVGTATWIVGQDQSKDDNDINVSVDDVKNRSVVLTTTLSDNAIALKEHEEVSEGILKTEGGVDPNALNITFSEIKLVYGKSYFNPDSQNLELSFAIKYKDAEGSTINSDNLIKDEGNKIGDKRTQGKTADSTGGESVDSWEYIAAPDMITLTGTEGLKGTDETTGLDTLTFTNKTVSFKWGSFFNGKSPCNYYNGLSFDNQLKAMNDIASELEAMKTALDGKNIVLEASIAVA